ncbi:MAG TPA: hypothetical protein VGL69_10775 [Solirubrobacteraceae bacterium]
MSEKARGEQPTVTQASSAPTGAAASTSATGCATLCSRTLPARRPRNFASATSGPWAAVVFATTA